MSTYKYWKRREVKLRKRLLDKTIEETEHELSIQYKKTAKKIVAEIEKLYTEIKDAKGEITINHLYQYNKYYDMLDSINRELKRLGKHEATILNHRFTKMYNDNEKLLNHEFGLSSAINMDKAKRVVNEFWGSDMLDFSSRIWKNKTLLNQKLLDGLFNIVASGKGIAELEEELMTTFNQSYSNAKRLVVTELNRILIDSTIDKYKEAGLTKYRFLTARDEKVCPICNALDGKVFYLTDKSHLPVYGTHPNCRCTITGVIDFLE